MESAFNEQEFRKKFKENGELKISAKTFRDILALFDIEQHQASVGKVTNYHMIRWCKKIICLNWEGKTVFLRLARTRCSTKIPKSHKKRRKIQRDLISKTQMNQKCRKIQKIIWVFLMRMKLFFVHSCF